MTLELPDVTLVAVETMSHDLMQIALEDCVAKANFGGIIIYSDQPDRFNLPGAVFHTVPHWPSKNEEGAFYYGEAAQAITTSHALMIEWDAGIRDVGMWRDEFLQYDYIGAPWPQQWAVVDHMNVGNGGFMLMSKRLSDVIYAHRERLRVHYDFHISREHRRRYEQLNPAIRWAPESVAADFAFELGTPEQRSKPSFGYHDAFNWPIALSREEVIRRVRLAMQDDYIVENTAKLTLISRQWPWVGQAIGTDFGRCLGRFVGARRTTRTRDFKHYPAHPQLMYPYPHIEGTAARKEREIMGFS